MEFKADKPIFRQIVELCHNRILDGQWEDGQKIPSVRELSVELTVNTRTVLSAFDVLEQEGVIITRRGLGYFLTEEARARVLALRRQEFFDTIVPEFLAQMHSLGITFDEILEKYGQYINC
ncbi:MAG: GntR family transcriptional regulator [Bacteroidales bacterium]|nr:GntR family transcriptional regulator [Bacteroidales bacterium]